MPKIGNFTIISANISDHIHEKDFAVFHNIACNLMDAFLYNEHFS